MTHHRIDLPNALKLHTVRNLMSRTTFFPAAAPQAITLAFHPQYSQFEPVTLAMLAAWGDYWTSRGVPIHLENLTAKGVAYAQRMGLFRHLSGGPSTTLEEHDESGRFVELQKIHKHSDLTKLVADLGALLRIPSLIELAQYILSEMTSNVLEHAAADAFVCAQYYHKVRRVSIAIADCGKGLLSSLRQNYNFQTDVEAIIGALRPGVSGTTATPYGSPDNAGLGLFYARGLAKWTQQYFFLMSGSAAYRQRRKQPTTAPSRDPRGDSHDLFPNLLGWNGTVVAVDIAAPTSRYADIMQAIGSATGPDDSLRDVKSKIQFT